MENTLWVIVGVEWWLGLDVVLILIIMENTLWVSWHWCKKIRTRRLNPYYNGKYSMSTYNVVI